MTPQDWARLKQFFDQTIDLDPADRAEFLASLDHKEPALAAELRDLLAEVHSSGQTSDALGSTSVREFVSSLGAASPEQLGGYKIVQELGRGASSIVFHASRESGEDPAEVAVKIFRFADWDEARKRQFSTERDILGQLDHPNIARMFTWGMTPIGLPYLVMELVEGQTLDAFCAEHAPSLDERLSLFRQILEAVGFAHRNSIVHRDLKPANILVTADRQVKLLDFGISKLFESDPDATATLERRFTPAYASPEQIRGAATGQASDIYSLGVILYELLTGRLPYLVQHRNASELSVAVVEQTPVPPSEISPQFSKQFDHVLLRALDKSPAKRYSSVAEFAGELSVTKPAATSEPRKRRRFWAAATCALAAGLLLILVWLTQDGARKSALHPGLRYPVTASEEFAAYPSLSLVTGRIAYASDRDGGGPLHIWLQRRIGQPPVRLTSGVANDTDPDLSADDQWIAFHSERNPRGIYIVPAAGGPEQFLAPFGQSPRFSPVALDFVYWTPDPHTRFGSIWKISLDRPREPFRLATTFEDAHNPVWTPDGRSVLFCGTRRANGGPPEGHDLWVVSEDGTQPVKTGAFPLLARFHLDPHLFILRSTSIRWLDEGVLLAARQNGVPGLWVIPLSRRTWKVTGDPYPFDAERSPFQHPAISRSAYAFVRSRADLQVWSLPVTPEAAEVRGPLEPVTRPTSEHFMPSASVDGHEVVFLASQGGQTVLYSSDGQFGNERPLSGLPIQANRVKVSGDGHYVFWRVLEGEGRLHQAIYRMDLNGGKRNRVCEDCGDPVSTSLDGSLVLFENGSAITRIGVLRTASSEKRDLIVHPYHPVQSARLSPDGKWIVFSVDRGYDGKQLLVAPFRASGLIEEHDWVPLTPADQIAEEPAWSPAGKWIYYFDRTDGFRCLRARQWNSLAGKPSGNPVTIQHFHSARRSPLLLVDRDPRYVGLSVARDRLFFTLAALDSQIWRADLD